MRLFFFYVSAQKLFISVYLYIYIMRVREKCTTMRELCYSFHSSFCCFSFKKFFKGINTRSYWLFRFFFFTPFAIFSPFNSFVTSALSRRYFSIHFIYFYLSFFFSSSSKYESGWFVSRVVDRFAARRIGCSLVFFLMYLFFFFFPSDRSRRE